MKNKIKLAVVGSVILVGVAFAAYAGMVKITCSNCKGQGYFPCPECNNTGWVNCHLCGGSGYCHVPGTFGIACGCSNGKRMCMACPFNLESRKCRKCGGAGSWWVQD